MLLLFYLRLVTKSKDLELAILPQNHTEILPQRRLVFSNRFLYEQRDFFIHTHFPTMQKESFSTKILSMNSLFTIFQTSLAE